METLDGMTSQRWKSLTEQQRQQLRSNDGLTQQLIGMEGWRVEVVTDYDEKRRFIVGRSTGWIPCHIEVKRRDSTGGPSAEKHYKSVKRLYKVER
jgi:hypothetical protein